MAKILIVDDDQGFIDATTQILQNAGFEVLGATTPEDGLSKAQSEKPALILLDVTLKSPEDGILMGKELYGKGLKIPVIILENVAKAATHTNDTSDLAVEAYAEKPLDPEKIVNKISAIINR
ncbi:MAG: response regulator [Spirochaetales bacterium]|nr:response regulator [Spirochaetales bacterium]